MTAPGWMPGRWRWPSFLALGLLMSGCVAAPGPPRAVPLALACPPPCATPVPLGSDAPREADLAVDPNDARHVVVLAAMVQRQAASSGQYLPLGDLVSAASFDGGASWTTATLPFPAPKGLGDDAPVVLFPDGTALAVGLGLADAQPTLGPGGIARSLYAWRSADGGRSWSAPVVLVPGKAAAAGDLSVHDNDGPWLATRGSDVLLTWGRYDTDASGSFTATFSAVVSHDEGRTWSTPAALGSGPQVNDGFPAILPDGTLVAAWNDHAQAIADPPDVAVLAAASTDGGATWRAVPVANGSSSIWPRLAVVGGEAVLCTTLALDGAGDAWVERSSRDGLSWSAPSTIATHGHPLRPAPMCAGGSDGTLWTSGYDDAKAFRVVVRASSGSTATLVVDSGPTDVGNAPTYGEYTGLATGPGRAALAWMSGTGGATKLLFARVAATSGSTATG